MYGGDVKTIVKIIKTLDEITAKNKTGMEENAQKQFSSVLLLSMN
jgi:hypothetical protein